MSKQGSVPSQIVQQIKYEVDPLTGLNDPIQVFFRELAPSMVRFARVWRDRYAESYREFYVGSTILGNNVGEQEMAILTGYNFTPMRGARKYCAEMRANGHGVSRGYTRPEVIVTAGTTDPKRIESVTGIPSRILPPCSKCRELIQPASLVLSIGDKEDIFTVHSGEIMKKGHLLAPENATKREQKKQQQQLELGCDEPIYDLSRVNWADVAYTYGQQTTSINRSFREYPSVGAFRLARTQAAVAALARPDYLLGNAV